MDFITGNKFKLNCNFSLDENGYNLINDVTDILKIFVKIDLINVFFDKYLPQTKFILFTHNGDLPITSEHLKYLNNDNLLHWFGQNVMVNHNKLSSIPIGIANEIWPHGNESIINDVINNNHIKENLLYINFDINTNRYERSKCLEILNSKQLFLSEKKSFNDYLIDVSKSYFVVSPNGNGVDCHKTWESLYLKTIPIVTKSINIDFYKDLPIIILNDWNELDITKLNQELYNKLWGTFNIDELNFTKYIKNETKIRLYKENIN